MALFTLSDRKHKRKKITSANEGALYDGLCTVCDKHQRKQNNFFVLVLVLPGERLAKLIHQDSQDDMAASIAGSFDGTIYCYLFNK